MEISDHEQASSDSNIFRLFEYTPFFYQKFLIPVSTDMQKKIGYNQRVLYPKRSPSHANIQNFLFLKVSLFLRSW